MYEKVLHMKKILPKMYGHRSDHTSICLKEEIMINVIRSNWFFICVFELKYKDDSFLYFYACHLLTTKYLKQILFPVILFIVDISEG